MTLRRSIGLGGLVAGLLAVAVGLQLLAPAEEGELGIELPAGGLAAAIPQQLEHGTARDEVIASTEEMKKAVGELLNYDDAVYRIYQQPGYRVSVYIAVWKAGRMSPRLVATHTPDVCWPGNGWERDRAAEPGLVAVSEKLSALGLPSGECRLFRMQGTPEHVVFWHKVGDEILSYGTGYAPPWWAWLQELFSGGLNLRKAQLFVRISSDQPIERLTTSPELLPLWQALQQLGLGAVHAEVNAP